MGTLSADLSPLSAPHTTFWLNGFHFTATYVVTNQFNTSKANHSLGLTVWALSNSYRLIFHT